MIGYEDFIEGIYHLNLQNNTMYVTANINTSNVITILDNDLWYFRLGHLSSFRTALLNSDFPFIFVDKKGICYVCHLEKHINLPYQISFNKVIKPFLPYPF